MLNPPNIALSQSWTDTVSKLLDYVLTESSFWLARPLCHILAFASGEQIRSNCLTNHGQSVDSAKKNTVRIGIPADQVPLSRGGGGGPDI